MVVLEGEDQEFGDYDQSKAVNTIFSVKKCRMYTVKIYQKEFVLDEAVFTISCQNNPVLVEMKGGIVMRRLTSPAFRELEKIANHRINGSKELYHVTLLEESRKRTWKKIGLFTKDIHRVDRLIVHENNELFLDVKFGGV